MVLTKQQKLKLLSHYLKQKQIADDLRMPAESTFEATQIVRDHLSEPEDPVGEITFQGREVVRTANLKLVGALEKIYNRLESIEKVLKKKQMSHSEKRAYLHETSQRGEPMEEIYDQLEALQLREPLQKIYTKLECVEKIISTKPMTFEEEIDYIMEARQRGEDSFDIYERLGY